MFHLVVPLDRKVDPTNSNLQNFAKGRGGGFGDIRTIQFLYKPNIVIKFDSYLFCFCFLFFTVNIDGFLSDVIKL